MTNISIIGIMVDARTKTAPDVQEVLTNYGDNILSRLGIHDPGEKDRGLITITFTGDEDRLQRLIDQLSAINGVTAKAVRLD